MTGKKRPEDNDRNSEGKPEDQASEKLDAKKIKIEEEQNHKELNMDDNKNVASISTIAKPDVIDLTEASEIVVDTETSTEAKKESVVSTKMGIEDSRVENKTSEEIKAGPSPKGKQIEIETSTETKNASGVPTKMGIEDTPVENKISEEIKAGPSPKEKQIGSVSKGKLNEDKSVLSIGDSTLTATVFLAAPSLKNHKLAITGNDMRLGSWKQPKGNFEQIYQISKDLFIFKGIVPIPSRAGVQFKFVHVNEKEESKIEYEGDGPLDNRSQELLPDTWNFFIFKPKSKSMASKFFENLTKLIYKSETREDIAVEFFNILFTHIMDNLLSDWDSTFEFLDDSLQKVKQAVESQAAAGFRKFLHLWLQKPELQVNFDQLMLLIVGACKMDVYTEKIKDVLQPKHKEFSIYLHNFRMKRRRLDLVDIMKRIATHAGREFTWILFRINRQTEITRSMHQEASESIIQTLQDIPEVLLDYPEVTSRAVECLVRWKNIEDLYRSLRPVFARNAEYQRLLEPILLQKFLNQKSSIEDLFTILRSDLLKKAYFLNSIPQLDDEYPLQQNHANLFQESIKKIFNQKFPDMIRLACRSPEYMFPIVENILLEKLKAISTFNKDDYRFFSQLEDGNLNNFPRAKENIEALLLKITLDHLKSGSFQSVPSLKLILIGLAERRDEIPLLERAKIVDLQKATNRLPRKFLQNLHSLLNASGVSVDKTLKPYRKGITKDVVERLETHLDMLEEILSKVQKHAVPLIELSSLHVSKHLFLIFYNRFNGILFYFIYLLQDPQVIDCLKNIGLTEAQQAQLRQNVEELKRRHNLYGALYVRFARLNVIRPTADRIDEDGDENDGDNGFADANEQEIVQVLDPKGIIIKFWYIYCNIFLRNIYRLGYIPKRH